MPKALNMSEAAALALHTMVLLGGSQEAALSTHDIATRLARSEAHLAKVLQRLIRAGFVSSSRGPRGGFVLARPAGDIVMLEVLEAIDGPVGDVSCTQTPPACDGQSCVFGQLVSIVNRQVREYLGSIRLSELVLHGPGSLTRIAPAPAVPLRRTR